MKKTAIITYYDNNRNIINQYKMIITGELCPHIEVFYKYPETIEWKKDNNISGGAKKNCQNILTVLWLILTSEDKNKDYYEFNGDDFNKVKFV